MYIYIYILQLVIIGKKFITRSTRLDDRWSHIVRTRTRTRTRTSTRTRTRIRTRTHPHTHAHTHTHTHTSMRVLGTRRRLFKMAANLHIMSYPYRHFTPIFSKMAAFSYLHRYALSLTCSCIDPPLPLQPIPPILSPTPLHRQCCQTSVYVIILNCFTHIA